jgi:hypothetical protein
MGTYLLPQNEAFAWRYQKLLTDEVRTARTEAEQSAVFAALTKGWAQSFVQDVLAKQASVVEIAKSFGSPCANEIECSDWLIKYVNHNGFSGQQVSIDATGDITVTIDGQVAARFSLKDLCVATAGRAIEVAPVDLKPDIDALVARINTGGSALTVEVVKSLPDVDFDRDVEPLIKSLAPERGAELLQNLTQSRPGGGAAPAAQDMAALAVGREIAQKTVFSKVADNVKPADAQMAAPRVASGTDPGQDEILTAMKAAGPYGFAAATAIQLISGIAQNGIAIDQINAKAAEDQKLTVELLHITGFEADMNRDEAIAALQERIATAEAASAASRSDLYGQALIDEGSQSTALQASIRRRLPLIFLLTEQLRERFDSLDHAIGFWENDLHPDGHFLERTLRNDPESRRLALDPDISLYDWFQRDYEGQRQDLDEVLVHWEGLEKLVHDLCSSLHCTRDDYEMNQVEMTNLISLRELVGPSDWKEAAKSRKLIFTILPQSLPNLPSREGLRIVDVAGAVSDSKSNYSLNPNVVLRHTGLGFVSGRAGGYRETLDTSGDLTPKFALGDHDANDLKSALQVRWRTKMSLQPLEGYPLYGVYSVAFPNDFDFNTSDLVLRLYYEWPVNGDLLNQRDIKRIFTCKSAAGSRVSVPSSEVALLLRRDDQGLPTLDKDDGCSLVEAK